MNRNIPANAQMAALGETELRAANRELSEMRSKVSLWKMTSSRPWVTDNYILTKVGCRTPNWARNCQRSSPHQIGNWNQIEKTDRDLGDTGGRRRKKRVDGLSVLLNYSNFCGEYHFATIPKTSLVFLLLVYIVSFAWGVWWFLVAIKQRIVYFPILTHIP